ncbi:MAG TPA: biosynthetic peptidoglycan transglycosylase [Gemmatimonadales bacterium]|nr:biosynthetic peptidoglycan transglycosylase [Gemmatimonadales bacterium]
MPAPRLRSILRVAGRLLVKAAVVFGLWMVSVWPLPGWYRTHFPRETAFMAMRRRQAPEQTPRYQPTPLRQISRSLSTAVLVSEDHRFYVHNGIDYIELLRALGYRRDAFDWSVSRDRSELWRAVGRAWSRREDIRGASTVSQQLAKNLYLSPSRNPFRKLKEALTAWRLEQALGKERILELYLNVAEMGPGIWGAEAASQAYFKRPARRLTEDQAAWLAATLPAPLRANPRHRPYRIRWRQELILQRMQNESFILPPVDLGKRD